LSIQVCEHFSMSASEPKTHQPVDPSIYAQTERESADAVHPSRRAFVLMGLGMGLGAMLAGCAPKQTGTTLLPGPVWRPHDAVPPDATVARPPAAPQPANMPSSVVPRSQWATAGGVAVLMNRMLPVQYITVHHDGMEPFYGSDGRSAAGRLEAIRRAHRDKGWGDIGYHFAIDRQGRVWEARSLAWQGAHVKDHNEGNIGICTLGNFDRQTPTAAQTEALNRHVAWLMHRYNVGAKRVLTHKEWPSAQTACPGTNLQRYMEAVRSSQKLG
jgi:hypothetical protein